MYLDTDVILGELKVDDWLAPTLKDVEFSQPKTSVVTVIEIQLVMFDIWFRSRLAGVATAIENLGIAVLPLTKEVLQSSADNLQAYSRLNVFDSLHIGHAVVLGEPIISTDSLYPDIESVTHHDPRSM